MRERVGLYGGTMSAGPRPGGGFEVRVVLPVPPAAGPEASAPAPWQAQQVTAPDQPVEQVQR